MNNTRSKPFYLVAPDSPVIEEHQQLIEDAVASKQHKLALSVSPFIIDMMDVSTPHEIILALQYFPQHISRMLGTFHFDFQLKADNDDFIPEEQWKKKRKFMNWFTAMGSMEITPFFAKDKDVRLYMIAGDYIGSGSKSVEKREDAEGRISYLVHTAARTVIWKRLFACCKEFLFYCHGSGFDPKESIQSLLADFSLPLEYAEIHNKYQKDIKHYAAIYKSPEHAFRFRVKRKT